MRRNAFVLSAVTCAIGFFAHAVEVFTVTNDAQRLPMDSSCSSNKNGPVVIAREDGWIPVKFSVCFGNNGVAI